MTKVRWEQFALFHEQITLLLTKNELIAWKPDEQIPNPGGQPEKPAGLQEAATTWSAIFDI